VEKAPLYNDLAEGPTGGNAWWLTTGDGVRIRVGYWPEGENGTVLMFPGRTEYVEKYGRTAGYLAQRGYGMLAVDWRGQGLADRLADDPMLGHVGKFKDYQLDVASVIDLAGSLNLPRPWYLLAHSMGGCIGLRALQQGLPVEAVAFSAPMWGIGVSSAMRPVAWSVSYLSRLSGMDKSYVPSTGASSYVLSNPFEGNSLTGDPEVFEYMQRQVKEIAEFGLGGPSLRWLHEALLETRKLRQMPAPAIPAVTFLGECEEIVDLRPIHDVMNKWASGKLIVVDNARHEFPMEQPHIRKAFLDAVHMLYSGRAGDT